MIIESIELKNYRNYRELHMEFDPGTNILYGNNAQGKQIFWKRCMYAVPPSLTGAVKIGS